MPKLQILKTLAWLAKARRLTLALAIAAPLIGCSGGEPFVSNDSLRADDYPIHGIDVSKYQGEVDWPTVAASGVKFAWIKATEGGDRLDERFAADWQGAKDAGIRRGAYLFAYWCRAPEDEIAWFEQNCPSRRTPCAGARRRADAGLENLPSAPGARPHRGRNEDDARRDGAPLRQEADHLYID